jgi:amino acid transporter
MADLAANRGPELMFDLAGPRLAPWAVTLGRVLLLTGLLAAMISLQHTISRYVFAFGRERILPSWLGRTARRTSAPRAASLFTSVVVALLLAVAVLFGVDPPAHLLAVSGALVLLLLLVGASLAALLQLNRAPDGENVWLRFVAPLVGTVALASLAYLACVKLPVLLGDQRWIVLASMSGLVVFGLAQAAVIRLVRPVIYAGIGLGGAAVVLPTPVRVPQPRTPGAHRPERIVR